MKVLNECPRLMVDQVIGAHEEDLLVQNSLMMTLSGITWW